jgi:hypothetical protein
VYFGLPAAEYHADFAPPDDARMTESINETQRLLQEIAAHMSSGTKTDALKAVAKLERIAALASTAALTTQVQRTPGSPDNPPSHQVAPKRLMVKAWR